MIEVTYKDEETGQEATFSIEPNDDESANVKMNFDPSIDDGTKDPYGILARIVSVFQEG